VSTYCGIAMNMARTSAAQVPDVYDIHFNVAGVLVLVEDSEAVAQRVRQHIEAYRGEWFLDRTDGVEWLTRIFVQPFSQDVAEALLKTAILDVPGVAEIIEFDMQVDPLKRSLKVLRIAVRTDFDEEVQV